MIRIALLAGIVLASFAVAASARDRPSFTLTAEASRTGDRIQLALKIAEDGGENVPNLGNVNVTTIRFSPRIELLEGQRALISIGRTGHSDGHSRPATEPADMDSGITVEAISVKGRDSLLIVASVVQAGSTIWADAITVKVQSKLPPTK